MTEALRQRGAAVTLVELAPQVFIAADPETVEPVHEQLRLHGVDLRLSTSVKRIEPAGDNLVATLSDGQTVEAGLVILAIGVRPETKLAKEAGLAIGATGGIVVDEHMRTSDPSIYAVGDAVEVTNLVSGGKSLDPARGPANRQGRIAADSIFGRPTTYKASQAPRSAKSSTWRSA